MKTVIIGGGFTGLACASRLIENGHQVTIYEASAKLGGLASGFNPGDWKWSLEIFYHHIFTNDNKIIDLAEKVGWPVRIKSPITTSFVGGEEKQLDSPLSLLKFSSIDIFSRLWMGAGLLFLKLIPEGTFLETYKVTKFLPLLLGKRGYQVIWERLLKAKFGPYMDKVNMAWFWTRVAKRTKNLGYFDEGFQKLADKMGEYIAKKGGVVLLDTSVKNVKKVDGVWKVNGEDYDNIVITTPAPIAEKITGKEIVKWPKIDYLWGQTLVLELEESLIGGYWMNILEDGWPFLVAVEHTNMIDKKKYGGRPIVYLGNYLPEGDPRLELSDKELINLYLPFIKKINSKFDKKWIYRSWKFQQPYSQPVFPVNYSKMIPEMTTPEAGLFVANMSMVYPFDRGTNYAVDLGERVAMSVMSKP